MIQDTLNRLLKTIENNKDLIQSIKNGSDFEDRVLKELKNLWKKDTDLGIKDVKHNGTHAFPDLTVTFNNNSIYGVEIKFSATGNWKSKGNSIFESLSNKNTDDNAYKEIYVFFGRKPKQKENRDSLEVLYKPYGSAIDKIEVTHSPRFAINMNTSDDNLSSFFHKQETTYAEFRTKSDEEKNNLLREYFKRNQNSSDKWYLPVLDEETVTVEPILFSALTDKQKSVILSESFILYPNNLFRHKANYSNTAKHMITQHFVYSPSLRDCFSAGGRIALQDDGILYPRILKTFKENAYTIVSILDNPPYENFEEECINNWKDAFKDCPGVSISNNDDLKTNYENIIKYFKPKMSVKNGTQGKSYLKPIDLENFYF